MNKSEVEQLRSFLRGSQKDKEAIFLEYLDRFKDDINFKKKHFKRYLDPTEVDTDAIFAIEDMFLEVHSSLRNAEERVYFSRTNPKINSAIQVDREWREKKSSPSDLAGVPRNRKRLKSSVEPSFPI